ncbi:DNA cytosine methyltransferase [Robbsia andropogonis]|uniref:DNA cytosine methyltransferase n=1 Tax=Robbsia andropogonis TaxID=28092 RepID=UPI002A6AE3A7|nr:DNA cytosine methyltransferase [Robbsia andropogonis]
MTYAYYNEIDPYAAAWLRNLISAGHIAPGVVDERSIEDVRPDDLREFTQCHFFAGIGVWSHALRRAGWSDDRPVWTGSCPCQPFSAAGKGVGFADERHLWPAFFHLISECKPAIVFGEQVASKDADAWIDLVHADVEAMGYAFGCVPFPSAGVGAPHIRDRAYWVADAADVGQHGRRSGKASNGRDAARIKPERLCPVGRLGDADSECAGWNRRDGAGTETSSNREGPQHGPVCDSAWVASGVSGMADANDDRREAGRTSATATRYRNPIDANGGLDDAGPTNGFWRDADWLGCRDGKWRPVEPGTFALVNGAPARVGRLRAYGNAINTEAAKVFIEATNL